MVLEEHEGKTGPRSQRDKNLKETSLWIPVSNANRIMIREWTKGDASGAYVAETLGNHS